MYQPPSNSASSTVAIEGATKNFSKARIIKNLVVVSLGSLLFLGSDDMIVIFQSTINRAEGVGVASVAVQYASTFVSSFFLPKYLVLKYGSKAILILSTLLLLPFLAANYYPLYSLMIVSSILLGVGFSLFWGSLDPYINGLSSLYADRQLEDLPKCSMDLSETRINSIDERTNLEPDIKTPTYTGTCNPHEKPIDIEAKPPFGVHAQFSISNDNDMETKLECITPSFRSIDSVSKRTEKDTLRHESEGNTRECETNLSESTTVRFFGFHSLIYQTCYVLSSVTSFYVLQSGFSQSGLPPDDVPAESCSCGADYCNVETACSERNLQQPSTEAVYVLISMCVGMCVLAVVAVAVFLDDLKRKDKSVVLSLDMLLATFRQMKKKNHLLLVPLTVNNGMMKGFYLGDFTKSYVGCAWGIQYLGLVTACAGGTMAFTSTMSGWLVKHLGRLPIFVAAAALNTLLNLVLIKWQPNPDQPAMFFVAAGLWGGLFGTFHTQVRAFYGVLFRADEEAAFGAYQLWYSVGSCLCLSYSNYICNDTKIYLLVLFSTLGIIGYMIVERSHSLTHKQNLSADSDKSPSTNTKCNQKK